MQSGSQDVGSDMLALAVIKWTLEGGQLKTGNGKVLKGSSCVKIS